MKTSTRRLWLLIALFSFSGFLMAPHVRSADREVIDPATGLPAAARAQPLDPATGLPMPAQARPAGYDLVITNGFLRTSGKGPVLEATLANVIDALREMYPEATIAVPPSLADVQVVDLKLRTGNLWDSLEAVCVATGGKFEWVGPGANAVFTSRLSAGVSPTLVGAVDPQTGLTSWGARANSGLFVLREPSPTAENTRMVEAFNIAPYLEFRRRQATMETGKNLPETRETAEKRVQSSLEQIKAIIGDTIAAVQQGRPGGPETPTFQFHPGAALLVVVGTPEAVEVARKVVNALPDQVGAVPGTSAALGGLPNTDDAFRARYGLGPQRPGNVAPATSPSAEQEQFRRRYGLEPGAGSGAPPPANKTPDDPFHPPR